MRTHPLNVGYLVVGVVFLGLSASWALHEAGVVSSDDVQWVLPATLVLAGAAGLLASALRATRGGAVQAGPFTDRGDTGTDDPLTYRYEEQPVHQPAEPLAVPTTEVSSPSHAAPHADITTEPTQDADITTEPTQHADPSSDPSTDDTTKDQSR
jgi:hypothetical protein